MVSFFISRLLGLRSIKILTFTSFELTAVVGDPTTWLAVGTIEGEKRCFFSAAPSGPWGRRVKMGRRAPGAPGPKQEQWRDGSVSRPVTEAGLARLGKSFMTPNLGWTSNLTDLDFFVAFFPCELKSPNEFLTARGNQQPKIRARRRWTILGFPRLEIDLLWSII